MPLDSLNYARRDDFYGNRYLGAKYTFAWLPKRCDISGKYIWLKHGYKLTAIWHGPGSSVFEERWHDSTEHIIWKLKQ